MAGDLRSKWFFSWAHEAPSTGPNYGYREGGAHIGSFLERSLEWAWLHACALSGGVNGRVMGPRESWALAEPPNPAAEQSCHLLLTSPLEEGGPRVSPALLAINDPRQRAASPPPSSWGWWSLMGLTHRVGRSPRAKSPKATPLEETRGSGRLCCGCGAALGQSRLPSTLLLGD